MGVADVSGGRCHVLDAGDPAYTSPLPRSVFHFSSIERWKETFFSRLNGFQFHASLMTKRKDTYVLYICVIHMCFLYRNTSDFAYFCLAVEMTHKSHRYACFNIYDRGKCSWERFAPFPCNEHEKQLTFLQFLSVLVVPPRGIVTLLYAEVHSSIFPWLVLRLKFRNILEIKKKVFLFLEVRITISPQPFLWLEFPNKIGNFL